MRSVLRSLGAVLVGAIVAVIAITAIEAVNHAVYPLPDGFDSNDPEALKAAMTRMPLGAKIFVLVGWGSGTLLGAWVAARLASRFRLLHGMVVGVLFLASGIACMVMIPSPVWFWIAGVALFLPAAYVGGKLARTGRETRVA